MIKLSAILLFLGVAMACSAPLDDLASPHQATRDDAAKILRTTYVPPPRTTWEPLLAKLVPGLPAQSVADLLRQYRAQMQGSASGGGGTTNNYRLDGDWILEIGMDDRAGKLIQAQLVESLAQVWVAPSSSFTGLWTTYYLNGVKSNVISYRNGVYFGEFRSYRSDGTKCVVQHYDAGGCDGDDTGYFPSGKIMYRAHYKNNVPVGIWSWYREDGTVSNTQDHTK